MWEFAALVQYIYSFGRYMKIPDEYGIDLLETECLKPGYSPKLLDLGLTLLKFVSSHRGLTYANFDEYTRRQYLAKAPSRNPFGDDAEAFKFNELGVVTKIRVLHQLTMWTSWNPDRFRAQMPEQKENQQISWRIEEFGYDSEDRYYYVLDDNRLYRRTNPPISASQPRRPKANSKRGRALARAAKKRKLEEASNDVEPTEGEITADQGYRWECLAITLDQYQAFVGSLQGSDDPDEQVLRDRLIEHVIPIIEKQEEAHQRKLKQRERELSNMERLAHAKRSSRIAMKQEQERLKMEMEEERRAQEAERQKQVKQEELQRKLEKEHQQRLLTREKRLKEREVRRREREDEIARVTEEAKELELGEKRMSERRLKTEIDKRKKALEELKGEENWIFDCSGCGVYGENHVSETDTFLTNSD
ncbi:hypothetical protein KEM56_003099 [Ascosphaera pollenicola]|nr:hypothetical protein KEM56_003099 [Ascosphaera pollenicola]